MQNSSFCQILMMPFAPFLRRSANAALLLLTVHASLPDR